MLLPGAEIYEKNSTHTVAAPPKLPVLRGIEVSAQPFTRPFAQVHNFEAPDLASQKNYIFAP